MMFNSSIVRPVIEYTDRIDTIYVSSNTDILYSLPTTPPLLDNNIYSSGFGNRLHPIFAIMKPHNGIDIPCKIGTTIYAQGNGRVIRTGWSNGYGNTIDISHGLDSIGNEISVRYAHLSNIIVKIGTFVKKGDIIGKTGNTGHSSAPHLHYEYHISGKPVNPLKYINFEKQTNSICNKSEHTYSMYEKQYESFYQLSANTVIANCKFLQYKNN